MKKLNWRSSTLLVTALAGSLLAWKAQASSDEEKQSASSFLQGGYLAREDLPDSLAINPLPPSEGSAAMARDEERAMEAIVQQGTPRFELAAADAAFFLPGGDSVFSCSAGFVIGPKTTPKLFALLRKSVADLALAVYPTKNHYQRQRPFMVNGHPTCTPDHEPMLRQDGSYPSGHTAIGYGWGLILAEVVPERATQLVARGRVFGDSRRICNVHWQSDVDEGQQVGAAVVARLHADAQFRADVEAAREEYAQLAGSLPQPDCTLEDAAFERNAADDAAAE